MLLLYPMFFMQIPYLSIFSGLWRCEEYYPYTNGSNIANNVDRQNKCL